jgi:PHD/YefM family antitoxin component YafN of YafNO toxin-antitoxin module
MPRPSENNPASASFPWKGRIMTSQLLMEEPSRVDEPEAALEYAEVLSQVAAAGRPVIVRRNGEDLAAVIPLEHLELVREILALQEVEKVAAQIDWTRAQHTLRPPQSWFDDEGDDPFKPVEEPAS